MQGIFSIAATPYNQVDTSDVLSTIAKNNSSLNRNNPSNRTNSNSMRFECFIDDDSGKYESPLVGGAKAQMGN